MDFRNTSKRSSKGVTPKFSVPLELMAMRSSKVQQLDVSAMTARAMTANWWRTKLISLAGGTERLRLNLIPGLLQDPDRMTKAQKSRSKSHAKKNRPAKEKPAQFHIRVADTAREDPTVSS